MGRTLEQLQDGELAQCNRFIAWWLTEVGEDLRIVQRPNPPDFILESSLRRTWLEVTDVFFDDEDVDWQLSSDVKTRGILEATDDQFVAVCLWVDEQAVETQLRGVLRNARAWPPTPNRAVSFD